MLCVKVFTYVCTYVRTYVCVCVCMLCVTSADFLFLFRFAICHSMLLCSFYSDEDCECALVRVYQMFVCIVCTDAYGICVCTYNEFLQKESWNAEKKCIENLAY